MAYSNYRGVVLIRLRHDEDDVASDGDHARGDGDGNVMVMLVVMGSLSYVRYTCLVSIVRLVSCVVTGLLSDGIEEGTRVYLSPVSCDTDECDT